MTPPPTLPSTLPGHWETPEGLQMAHGYADMTRAELCMGHLPDMHVANGVYLAYRTDPAS